MTDSFAKLIILQGPTKLPSVLLGETRLIIGRLADSDLVLNDAAVSRHHAAITRKNLQYFIIDLNSRNKTFLNDEQLDPEIPACLANGDIIRIAGDIATLQFEDEHATIPLKKTAAKSRPGLKLDLAQRAVWVDGKLIEPPLSPPQFQFLWALCQNPDKVCGREVIINAIWTQTPEDSVSDQMIDALAARVRRRIRELGCRQDYIVTVRGFGFKYVP